MASSQVTPERENLLKNIENLKTTIRTNHPNCQSIKVMENVGEHAFVIKFTIFSDYDLNITLQISGSIFKIDCIKFIN